MKTLLFILPTLLVLGSCGQSSRSTPRKLVIFDQQFANDYVGLEKQTTSCQSQSFKDFSKSLNLNLYLNGNRTQVAKDFSPLLQGLFLKDTKTITRSVYGEKAEETYLISGEYLGYEVLTPEKEIDLCPDEDYAQDTIESAALNTAYYIQKTNLKISSLDPSLKIAPISLSIGRTILISYIYKNQANQNVKWTQYMTDNAFYSPNYNSISFLPQSLNAKKTFTTSLWEVPMVPSHEYGHHIFSTIAPNLKNDVAAVHDNNCFGQAEINHASEVIEKVERKATVAEVIGSFNEAFADLVSYYSLDPVERGVKDVTCLRVTRDVGSEFFANGNEKAYSKYAVTNFFSNIANEQTSCEQSNLQSIHNFGAIFAHSADKFLGQLKASDDQKLMATIEWLKHLNKTKHMASKNPRTYFEKAIKDFILMGLNKFKKDVNAETCNMIKEIYPAIPVEECSNVI